MARPPQRLSRSKPLTQLPPEPPVAAPATTADRRRFIYAGVDLALAGLHALIIVAGAPTRHTSGQLLMWSIVLGFAAAALGALVGRPRGWWLAAVACGLLLVLQVALLVVMVASAAYLSGVFGAFGRGAAGMTLAAAALTIQVVGLPAALELKYLRTRAGRRAFAMDATR